MLLVQLAYYCRLRFRLYECEIDEGPRLKRTWKVGPSGPSPSKIPSFAALGETAVDFDFASPSVKQEEPVPLAHLLDGEQPSKGRSEQEAWKQIEWPILVLRGSGDVLIVRGNVLTK